VNGGNFEEGEVMAGSAKIYRLPNGQLAKGSVLNPRGRYGALTPEEREARRLVRCGTLKAAKTLLALMDETRDDKVRLAACKVVLEESYRFSGGVRDCDDALDPDTIPAEVKLVAVETERARLLEEMGK
jgi:hypothetical protein